MFISAIGHGIGPQIAATTRDTEKKGAVEGKAQPVSRGGRRIGMFVHISREEGGRCEGKVAGSVQGTPKSHGPEAEKAAMPSRPGRPTSIEEGVGPTVFGQCRARPQPR